MKKLMSNEKLMKVVNSIYFKIFGLIALILIIITILAVKNSTIVTDSLGNEIIRFDRVAFTIFGRGIYFYALCIITGIIIAFIYANHTAKRIGFKENNLFDGFIIGTIIGILGARIYYAIFSWDTFKNNPLKIITGFFNEEGGLAIHGAVIAAAIFAYFFCKKRKEDILKLLEMLFPGFLIGQSFGRWGNFFNKEAHGGPISASVAESRAFLDKLPIPKFIVDQMYIYEDGYNYMHPTFLYESVWNLIGLAIIIFTRKYWRKYWYGDAALFYLVWYGIGRFFIEALRTDYLPVVIFGMELRVAQVVSLLMIVSGVVLFILRRVFKYKPISFIELVEQNG